LADHALYRSAVKRSVTIAGHPTSIRLEPAYWDMLNAESLRLGLPLNALVARIDSERSMVQPAPNLASALRLWVLAQAMASKMSLTD